MSKTMSKVPFRVDASEPPAVAFARRLQVLHRSRAQELGLGLFSDPAWDMLLDLFVSRYDRKALSVTDIGVGITGSAGTALRYLGMLQEKDLVIRLKDVRDGRRSYVELTAAGLAKVEALLASHAD